MATQPHLILVVSIHELVALHAAVGHTLRSGPGQATREGSRVRTLLLELQAGLLERPEWRRASDGGLEVLLELSIVQLWALQAAVRFSQGCIRRSSPDQVLFAQVLTTLSDRLLQACPTQSLPALNGSTQRKHSHEPPEK